MVAKRMDVHWAELAPLEAKFQGNIQYFTIACTLAIRGWISVSEVWYKLDRHLRVPALQKLEVLRFTLHDGRVWEVCLSVFSFLWG